MLYSLLNLDDLISEFPSLFDDDEEPIVSDQFLPILSDFNNRVINPENINEILNLCDYILLKDTMKFIVDHFSTEYKNYELNERHAQNYVLPGFMRGIKGLEEVGKCGNLRYIKHIFDDLDGSQVFILVNVLCEHGHLDALIYLFTANYGFEYDINTIRTAYRFGRLNCVKYMMEYKNFYKSLDQRAINQSMNNLYWWCADNLNCIKYMYETYVDRNEFRWSGNMISELYRANAFDSLQYVFDNGAIMHTNLSDVARINTGDALPCLIWALDHGTTMDNQFVSRACEKRFVIQLEFALKQNAFINANAMYYAIFNNHIDCVKLLIKYGYVATSITFNDACKCGFLRILEYLNSIDCPSHIDASCLCSENGHIMCLKYLYKKNYPISPNTCHYAFKNGHLNCLELAILNGCPWNLDISQPMIREMYHKIPQCHKKNLQNRRKDACFKWAKAHGNTWIKNVYIEIPL